MKADLYSLYFEKTWGFAFLIVLFFLLFSPVGLAGEGDYEAMASQLQSQIFGTGSIDQTSIYSLVVKTVAALMGIVFIVIGLRMAVSQKSREAPGQVIATLIAGVMFINFALITDVLSASIFGSYSQNLYHNPLDVAVDSSLDAGIQAYVKLAIGIVVFSGALAVMKGTHLLSKLGSGQQDVNMGVVASFLVSGTIMINLVVFVKILNNSIGGNVQAISNIAKLIGAN
ncbi:MAG: hypothetical protein IBX55_00035 [Methyloprofundus sp.]|nr:hypothetical protein [Methyloprofundus sp.]